MDPKIALLLFTLSAIVLSVSASPGKGPIESEIAVCIQNNNLFFRDFLSEVAGGGIGNDLGGTVRLYPRNGDILSHGCQVEFSKKSIFRKTGIFSEFLLSAYLEVPCPEDLATLFFLTMLETDMLIQGGGGSASTQRPPSLSFRRICERYKYFFQNFLHYIFLGEKPFQVRPNQERQAEVRKIRH